MIKELVETFWDVKAVERASMCLRTRETGLHRGAAFVRVDSEINHCKGDINYLMVDINYLKGDIKYLIVEIDHCKGEINCLMSEINHCKGEINHLKGEIKRIEGEINHLKHVFENTCDRCIQRRAN